MVHWRIGLRWCAIALLIAGWHLPLMVAGQVSYSDIVLIIAAVIVANRTLPPVLLNNEKKLPETALFMACRTMTTRSVGRHVTPRVTTQGSHITSGQRQV